MASNTLIRILAENGLKITPQRVAVLEVIQILKTHPTAEDISQYLKISHPHIAIGTVYKILKIFTEKGIINKIRTVDESMRYDSVSTKHHHLYCSDSDRIEDFSDEELDKIIAEHLKIKKIPNFKIEDIRLQLLGKFTDNAKNNIEKIKQ
jgi:Fur family transcriptional regulator, peroxide stress response regulator